jgi:hypothetical protein
MPFTLSHGGFETLAGLLVVIFALRALNVFGWFIAGLTKMKLVRVKPTIESHKK